MPPQKVLNIGPGLTLPIEVGTETIAVLGNRGMGKTNTAVVIVEELLDKRQQVCIIDPTDVWWGLKSSKDGKSAGYPIVVLGGRHADLPLAEDDGQTIADFIVDNPHVSVVCSTRGFESKGQELRFVNALCRRLYYRKGQLDNPTPLSIVFDEASRLVPQRIISSDAFAAHTVGAVQQLVRQGRSTGFGVMLIDQRAASVNKDVLELIELLVAHRVTGPLNRKTLKGWIEQHDAASRESEFLESLASLKRGEAWWWSPGFLDVFGRYVTRERRTFDSSATPKAGQARATPTTIATIDLAALKQQLGATIERERANNPDVLRKRIAELEHELIVVGQASVEPDDRDVAIATLRAELKDEYRRGYGDGQLSERDTIMREITMLRTHLARLAVTVQNATKDVDSLDEMSMAILLRAREPSVQPPSPTRAVPALHEGDAVVVSEKDLRADRTAPYPPPSAHVERARSNGDLKTQLANAFAFFRQFGVNEPRKEQLAAYLEYHPRTPTFTTALNELRDAGTVTIERGVVIPSEACVRRGKIEDTDRVRSLADLHRVWLSKLDGIPAHVVKFLINRRAATRTDIASALKYHPRTPTFTAALNKLESLGLVTFERGGVVRIGPALFPQTLR